MARPNGDRDSLLLRTCPNGRPDRNDGCESLRLRTCRNGRPDPRSNMARPNGDRDSLLLRTCPNGRPDRNDGCEWLRLRTCRNGRPDPRLENATPSPNACHTKLRILRSSQNAYIIRLCQLQDGTEICIFLQLPEPFNH
jgi:hypothetical protein